VVQARRHTVDKLAYQGIPAVRQVLGDATNAKPGRVHPAAGDGFDNAEQAFTVSKHIEHRRHLSYVLGKGAIEHQMT
jgi:hypothetical protein